MDSVSGNVNGNFNSNPDGSEPSYNGNLNGNCKGNCMNVTAGNGNGLANEGGINGKKQDFRHFV